MEISYCMVYITTKDGEEARKIAQKVVEERLAACANIVDNMSSLYHWKNKIEEDQESILILKTRMDLYPKLESFVKRHHSYEVPCILAYPVVAGNPDYLDWLEKETKERHH